MQRLWYQLASRWPALAGSCGAIAQPHLKKDLSRCKNRKRRCDSNMGICKPNTGWFTLVMAVQLCDRVSMYGFEAFEYRRSMGQVTKYHYFNWEVGETRVHSYELTMNVFNFMSRHFGVVMRHSGRAAEMVAVAEIEKIQRHVRRIPQNPSVETLGL